MIYRGCSSSIRKVKRILKRGTDTLGELGDVEGALAKAETRKTKYMHSSARRQHSKYWKG